MTNKAYEHGINAILVGVFAWVLYQTAWLCDDAYISYRTVENFVTGHGLTWNPGERVQAFTHPLWLFVNATAYALFPTDFITFMAVAMGTSLLVVLLFVYRMALSRTQAVLGVILFLCSRAFMDYATSGLENPLTHLLLMAFILVFVQTQWGQREVFLLAFIAGLGILNRMDTLLLYAPALAYVVLSQFNLKTIAIMVVAGSPFILWELFSLVYYGALVPNTAFAKLGTGIDSGAMAQQGFFYYLHTLVRDPATLPVILLGLVAPFFLRNGKMAMLALGMGLYLLYIIKIGGDFMGGRFFVAPYFLAVCLIVRMPQFRSTPPALGLALVVLYLSSLAPHAPYTTGADFGKSTEGFKDANGIGDERRFWYDNGSLTAYMAGKEMPAHSYVKTGKDYRDSDRRQVKVHGSVGFRGFFGGPKVHIVDYYALADPLLARLPAKYSPNWRIGHFTRTVPRGYEQTILTGTLKFQDQDLATYYGHLKMVVSGPLWSRERWSAIWHLNRGHYDDLIDVNAYRFSRVLKKDAAEVATPKQDGTVWNAPGNLVLRNGRQVSHDALRVQLDEVKHKARVAFTGDRNDQYKIIFFMGDKIVGESTAAPARTGKAGLATVYGIAPTEAIRTGYNSVMIWPYSGDQRYSLGHVQVLD